MTAEAEFACIIDRTSAFNRDSFFPALEYSNKSTMQQVKLASANTERNCQKLAGNALIATDAVEKTSTKLINSNTFLPVSMRNDKKSQDVPTGSRVYNSDCYLYSANVVMSVLESQFAGKIVDQRLFYNRS